MSQLLQALHHALRPTAAKIFDDGHWLDSERLNSDVARAVDTLRRLGVRPGRQVVIAMPNSYDFVVAYLALLQYGAIIVPVNPETPAAGLARVMVRFDASAALISNASSNLWQAELETAGFVQAEDEGAKSGGWTTEFTYWCIPSAQDTPVSSLEPNDETPAVLMFTSGTTGKPKGVLLTHGHLMAAVENVVGSHELTQSDITYCILPLFHINAQVIALLSTLISGGRVVMADKFHASRFWADVSLHGVTWVSCVPTVLSILTKRHVAKEMTQSLRFFRSASAPLTPAIAARLEAMYEIPVIESYGMTEAAGQICINALPPGTRKSGSVGRPHGLSLRIVDDTLNTLPPYQSGEIAIRGRNIIDAYVGMGPTPDTGHGPGWIYTGDLGYQDEEGYVFITGRAKEIINRAGEKLSPREIEDVINVHELVERSAVIGLPDPLYGERVVAWVVPADVEVLDVDRLRTDLDGLCAAHLAKHKCPSQIVIARSLPVNATGKVQKHLLREVEPRDMLA